MKCHWHIGIKASLQPTRAGKLWVGQELRLQFCQFLLQILISTLHSAGSLWQRDLQSVNIKFHWNEMNSSQLSRTGTSLTMTGLETDHQDSTLSTATKYSTTNREYTRSSARFLLVKATQRGRGPKPLSQPLCSRWNRSNPRHQTCCQDSYVRDQDFEFQDQDSKSKNQWKRWSTDQDITGRHSMTQQSTHNKDW